MPRSKIQTNAASPAEWKSPFDGFRTIGEDRNDRPLRTPLRNYFWLILAATLAGAFVGAGLFILGLTSGVLPEPDSRIMTDYDYLVSLLQGFTLAGAGLGLVTGLGCCIHWRVMRARDIRKLRNRTKAKPHTQTKF